MSVFVRKEGMGRQRERDREREAEEISVSRSTHSLVRKKVVPQAKKNPVTS